MPAGQTLSAADIRSPPQAGNQLRISSNHPHPRAHVHAKRAELRGGRSGNRSGNAFRMRERNREASPAIGGEYRPLAIVRREFDHAAQLGG